MENTVQNYGPDKSGFRLIWYLGGIQVGISSVEMITFESSSGQSRILK
jgi:hypothetical protein